MRHGGKFANIVKVPLEICKGFYLYLYRNCDVLHKQERIEKVNINRFLRFYV